MKLPSYAKKYFWDIDANKLDAARHADYVVARLLQYGDVRSMRWLLAHVSSQKIRRVIMRRRGLSSKSANFWGLFFGIPKNKILYLKKSYQKQRKSHGFIEKL